MKIKKSTNKKTKKKFPYRVYLDNGRIIPVPSQYNFSSNFIRSHGCSLVAMYMGLRFLGVKKSLSNCKKYLDRNYGLHGRKKYALSIIVKAMNKISSSSKAKFYKNLPSERIKKELKKGNMVLFEERDPIHTVVLLYNGKDIKRFSDGKYKSVTVNQEVKKQCGDGHYGGCIVIKK